MIWKRKVEKEIKSEKKQEKKKENERNRCINPFGVKKKPKTVWKKLQKNFSFDSHKRSIMSQNAKIWRNIY